MNPSAALPSALPIPERPTPASGYLHPAYAESLSEFGVPHLLPESGAWLLQRQISAFPYRDGMGCYPILACQDWSRLQTDLKDPGCELVSLSAVTDPFGECDVAYLRRCFKDVVMPFKEHFVIDLTRAPNSFVSDHHRRNAKRALREVHVEKCLRPVEIIDEWDALYSVLIERHGIKGMRAFSRSAFTLQLQIPGVTVFRGMREGKTVGMTLWCTHDEEVSYYHLGAYSPLGYEVRASFALFSFAIEYFAAAGLRWLNLGAGAGASRTGDDGLTRFKSGWATGRRTAYFCGRIYDQGKYSEIVTARGIPPTDYFPAYRSGEFD